MSDTYKPRWTVSKGPRVHEIARFLGLTSKDVIRDMGTYHDYWPICPSSRVPVGVALDYCATMRPRCSYHFDGRKPGTKTQAFIAAYPDLPLYLISQS